VNHSIRFLLVTCSKEQTRADILQQVVSNLQVQTINFDRRAFTVFDNASTIPGTLELLCSSFPIIYVAERNVGYWTAIDWWLTSMESDPPDYVYIIESDLIHHDFDRINDCAIFLDDHPTLGGVRLHEYVVAEKHLYDKDKPLLNSKRHAWRSHTNIVTGERVSIVHDTSDFYITTFPAHLPALNRYTMMHHAFKKLCEMPSFSEHDFQRTCHDIHQRNALLDGGLAKELAFNGSTMMGSFLPEATLKQMGYVTTRQSRIIPSSEYTITRLR